MKYSHLKIRALRRSGLTYSQIRERIGCCNETVRRAMTNDIQEFCARENMRKIKHRNHLRNGKKVWDGATIGRQTTSARNK